MKDECIQELDFTDPKLMFLQVGMPSSVFVKDSEIAEYSWKLLVMMSVLFLATFANWFFITKMKMSKYKSVAIAMSIWAGLGAIYYFVSTAGK